MPSSEEILAGLAAIANEWRWLSILWHGYFAVLILRLLFGVPPSRRVVGVLLAVPLLSVSILAWVYANPFNGAVFGITAIVLLVIAARLRSGQVKAGSLWVVVPGSLMIGFGWIYPHFLDDAAFMEYLYAAPTGLIPCPTLSIVIGFTLVLGGLLSRSWCLVLALVGLFYGVFGAARLGVGIDGVLVLGALVTACTALWPRVMERSLGETDP